MICKCSKIASKSMPNPYQNAQENPCQTKSEKWWMAKRAGTHRAPPTLSRGNTKSPSIQQSMWLVLLHSFIHWLSARRPNHKKGNSMCRIRAGNVRIDGGQKMAKLRPRIANIYRKCRPKCIQNGVKTASGTYQLNWRAHFRFFFRFCIDLGSLLGTILVPKVRKNISRNAYEHRLPTNMY